jgi:Ion channel
MTGDDTDADRVRELTTTTPPNRTGSQASGRPAPYRYGAVFMLVLGLALFEIVAPDASWTHAVSIALAAAALAVAVGTSRERGSVRRARALAVAVAALAIVIGIAVGLVDAGASFLIGAVVLASIPLALIRELVRLVRQRGVTVQAVLGSLAIYITVGLLFASTIGFVTAVQSGPYFTQGSDVTNGDRVYYSFTVMTTTGFGDYTAATPVGHALAVSEMLLGQLYLVTVIGVLVGNFAGRRP